MDRVLTFCMLFGIIGTSVGGYQCVKGYNYSVAAQHEATTVGRIVKVSYGKGGPAYRYQFSVNGVEVDDYSEVCSTPLAPDACLDNGQVLVYYSYQPYQNSRLEDFAIASSHAYRIGKPALAIGFPLLVLTVAGMSIQARKDKPKDDWPMTEATIQSVGKVSVNVGRSSYSVEVGDFTYNVNDEYYSGRLTISRSFSTHDHSPRDLVDQKIQVRYDPQKPEKVSVPQTELGGFLLDPYDEPFGQDVGPIDLNLDKI